MLIAVDCVSAQQRTDIILFSLAGGHSDGIVESGTQFLPLVECSSRVDSAVIILFLGNVDDVAIFIGHAVSADEEGAQVEFDGFVLVSFVFGTESTEVDLQSLPNLLVQSHRHCDPQCLIVVFLVDCSLSENQDSQSQEQFVTHYTDCGMNNNKDIYQNIIQYIHHHLKKYSALNFLLAYPGHC